MAGVDPHARPTEQSSAGTKAPAASRALLALACLLRVAVIALMASGVARPAWRARGDPWELASVAGPCALLAAIFVCLHRAERLAPDAPPGERRRLQVAVWVLSTAISCVFAYRVAVVMPPALAVLVWSMTASVVVAGFYMLVLFKDRRYQALDDDADVATDAAGDRKDFVKIKHTDKLV
ncbi:unnamed protein product [Urochloa decumbens]|uniref:Uncharacterized protein n=1 Tax=Urochloa decumbens TaxID=240449 RepID=A0ABC9GL08_9POAL